MHKSLYFVLLNIAKQEGLYNNAFTQVYGQPMDYERFSGHGQSLVKTIQNILSSEFIYFNLGLQVCRKIGPKTGHYFSFHFTTYLVDSNDVSSESLLFSFATISSNSMFLKQLNKQYSIPVYKQHTTGNTSQNIRITWSRNIGEQSAKTFRMCLSSS